MKNSYGIKSGSYALASLEMNLWESGLFLAIRTL